MLIIFDLHCIVLVTFIWEVLPTHTHLRRGYMDFRPWTEEIEIVNIGFYTGTCQKRLVLYVNYFLLALHRPCNFYMGRKG